jgi:hypothetical protein
VDVSVGEDMPASASETVVLGGAKGISGTTYAPSTAEWKKIRRMATTTGGALYWRVRALDSDKALSCGSGVSEIIVDAGEWTISQLDLASSLAVTWTSTATGFATYQLVFSADGSFDALDKGTIKMPPTAKPATSYTLTAADVLRLKRTAARTGATTLYYRAVGFDSEKAFEGESPVMSVSIP